jgi:DNA polymerase III subunit beta
MTLTVPAPIPDAQSRDAEAALGPEPVTITLGRAALMDALKTVGMAIPGSWHTDFLRAVLFDATPDGGVRLQGFDETTLITLIVPGTTATPGRMLIDHAELLKMLGALTKGLRKRDADALPVTIHAEDAREPTLSLNGTTMPLTGYSLDN